MVDIEGAPYNRVRMLRRLLLAALCAAPLFGVDFEGNVEPIFHTRCYVCHGEQQQMSGLRLDDGDAALAGGYSGKVILPGDAAGSPLMERVRSDKDGFRMPPAGAPLTEEEVAHLEEWINDGAEFPKRAPVKKLTEEQRGLIRSSQNGGRLDAEKSRKN